MSTRSEFLYSGILFSEEFLYRIFSLNNLSYLLNVNPFPSIFLSFKKDILFISQLYLNSLALCLTINGQSILKIKEHRREL